MGALRFFAAAALIVASSAQAASVSAISLGFDPAKFGLPIYPGARVKLGSAIAGRDFAGRSQRGTVLETADSVAAVTAWYATSWPGAVLQTRPGAPVQRMARSWGAGSISVSAVRAGPVTQIQLTVPGAY